VACLHQVTGSTLCGEQSKGGSSNATVITRSYLTMKSNSEKASIKMPRSVVRAP
jgi:hypothetical protein